MSTIIVCSPAGLCITSCNNHCQYHCIRKLTKQQKETCFTEYTIRILHQFFQIHLAIMTSLHDGILLYFIYYSLLLARNAQVAVSFTLKPKRNLIFFAVTVIIKEGNAICNIISYIIHRPIHTCTSTIHNKTILYTYACMCICPAHTNRELIKRNRSYRYRPTHVYVYI